MVYPQRGTLCSYEKKGRKEKRKEREGKEGGGKEGREEINQVSHSGYRNMKDLHGILLTNRSSRVQESEQTTPPSV